MKMCILSGNYVWTVDLMAVELKPFSAKFGLSDTLSSTTCRSLMRFKRVLVNNVEMYILSEISHYVVKKR